MRNTFLRLRFLDIKHKTHLTPNEGNAMTWYRDLRKDIWKYAMAGIILISIGLNVINYSTLQNSLARVNLGTSQAAISFSLGLGRATAFLDVDVPDEINKSIQAFTDVGQGALEDLWILTYLNPSNERALNVVEDVVTTLFVARDAPATVLQVLEQLRIGSSVNASTILNAITELKATTSQTIEEMGVAVAEAFAREGGVDTSRLDNAVNLANDLKTALNQWISKYSESS